MRTFRRADRVVAVSEQTSFGSETVYDEQGAAEYLSVPSRTLKSWRYSGAGPAFHRMGRLIRYTERELDAYIESTRVTPGAATRDLVAGWER